MSRPYAAFSLQLQKDGGQTGGFFACAGQQGGDLDYPSALQSLDRALGTIPCDVTQQNVKSFSRESGQAFFWDRAAFAFLTVPK